MVILWAAFPGSVPSTRGAPKGVTLGMRIPSPVSFGGALENAIQGAEGALDADLCPTQNFIDSNQVSSFK